MNMHTLYYAPDNASLIVRIVLEELGAPYETRLVDRSRREQESDDFRRLNPNGLIPVCIIDGAPVFETAAICLLLAERHGGLAPSQSEAGRAPFLQWLFFLSNTIHGDLRQLFYAEKFAGTEEAAQRHRRKTAARLQRAFGILDTAYAAKGEPYLLGASPSVVDIYAATCGRWVQLYPVADPKLVDLSRYAGLAAMMHALEMRPAVQRACAAEGIAPPAFTAPAYANPPEGSAT